MLDVPSPGPLPTRGELLWIVLEVAGTDAAWMCIMLEVVSNALEIGVAVNRGCVGCYYEFGHDIMRVSID